MPDKSNTVLYLDKKANKRYILYRPDYSSGKQIATIGGRYDRKLDAWKLPPIMASVEGLARLFGPRSVRMSDKLQARYDSPYGFDLIPESEYAERISPKIWNALHPYQREAVQYLYSNPHPGALLGLSPGLGKMLTTIAAAQAMGATRVLVISTLLLSYNWLNEIEKWTGMKGSVCYKEGPDTSSWVMTNFETEQKYIDDYQQPWSIVIVDESIMVKHGNPNANASRNTKRWRGIYNLLPHTRKIWLLSGGPVSKHADDLFGQFALMMPEAFTSYWRFARMYCHIDKTKWGDKVVGTNVAINLQNEFRDLMFIRDASQVFPDMPPAIFEAREMFLYPEQQELFDQMLADFIIQLEDGEELSAANKAAQLIRLQQIVSNPVNLDPSLPDVSVKRDFLIDLINTRQVPIPSVFWVHWTEGAKRLYEEVSDNTRLTGELIIGDVIPADRMRYVEAFQRGEIEFLVMSITTGKHGLSLTKAKSAVYVDKTFDAEAYVQSQWRIRRPAAGVAESALMITLRALGTTDDLVEGNLRDKAPSIAHVSNLDLAALLRSLQ